MLVTVMWHPFGPSSTCFQFHQSGQQAEAALQMRKLKVGNDEQLFSGHSVKVKFESQTSRSFHPNRLRSRRVFSALRHSHVYLTFIFSVLSLRLLISAPLLPPSRQPCLYITWVMPLRQPNSRLHESSPYIEREVPTLH